jgi:hypothetical protein
MEYITRAVSFDDDEDGRHFCEDCIAEAFCAIQDGYY